MVWPTVTADDPRFLPYKGAVDDATITARISDAEAIVQWELRERGVTEPPAGDALWATLYTQIICDIVIRYLQNPDGWVEETEAIDDYRVTKRRGNGSAPVGVFVTDDELARLFPQQRRPRGAWSIVPGYF